MSAWNAVYGLFGKIVLITLVSLIAVYFQACERRSRTGSSNHSILSVLEISSSNLQGNQNIKSVLKSKLANQHNFPPFASLTYPNMSLSQCLYLRKIQLSFFPPFLLCKHPWRHLLIILSWLINLAFYHLAVKWKKASLCLGGKVNNHWFSKGILDWIL